MLRRTIACRRRTVNPNAIPTPPPPLITNTTDVFSPFLRCHAITASKWKLDDCHPFVKLVGGRRDKDQIIGDDTKGSVPHHHDRLERRWQYQPFCSVASLPPELKRDEHAFQQTWHEIFAAAKTRKAEENSSCTPSDLVSIVGKKHFHDLTKGFNPAEQAFAALPKFPSASESRKLFLESVARRQLENEQQKAKLKREREQLRLEKKLEWLKSSLEALKSDSSNKNPSLKQRNVADGHKKKNATKKPNKKDASSQSNKLLQFKQDIEAVVEQLRALRKEEDEVKNAAANGTMRKEVVSFGRLKLSSQDVCSMLETVETIVEELERLPSDMAAESLSSSSNGLVAHHHAGGHAFVLELVQSMADVGIAEAEVVTAQLQSQLETLEYKQQILREAMAEEETDGDGGDGSGGCDSTSPVMTKPVSPTISVALTATATGSGAGEGGDGGAASRSSSGTGSFGLRNKEKHVDLLAMELARVCGFSSSTCYPTTTTTGSNSLTQKRPRFKITVKPGKMCFAGFDMASEADLYVVNIPQRPPTAGKTKKPLPTEANEEECTIQLVFENKQAGGGGVVVPNVHRSDSNDELLSILAERDAALGQIVAELLTVHYHNSVGGGGTNERALEKKKKTTAFCVRLIGTKAAVFGLKASPKQVTSLCVDREQPEEPLELFVPFCLSPAVSSSRSLEKERNGSSHHSEVPSSHSLRQLGFDLCCPIERVMFLRHVTVLRRLLLGSTDSWEIGSYFF